MGKLDREIQALLEEYRGSARKILETHIRLDYFYALSDQRELLLEWYDFDPGAELLQVGADYGAMTGLYASSVKQVTVLDEDGDALKTVKMRYPLVRNISYVQSSIQEYARTAGKTYGYVAMIAPKTALDREDILAAKSLLAPSGILIAAMPNLMGAKYWAGTKREENGSSKCRLTELLCGAAEKTSKADMAKLRFYYPMPDYRTPITIYCDAYLPKKGDLTRVTPVYDYPPYHVSDMGEGFDIVCEEGVFDQFANSFLVFWSDDEGKLVPAEDRIFIKYNKTRRDLFQLRTCIGKRNEVEGGGKFFVEKAALGFPGSEHILSFKEKYQALTRQQSVLKVLPPRYIEGRNAAYFPRLRGQTWAEQLGLQLQEGTLPMELLRSMIGKIFAVAPECRSPFVLTGDFVEVFGQGLSDEELAAISSDTACEFANIDSLFENIMDTQEGTYCLDYEWVFSFPVPEYFVRYRILYYFYEQYGSLIKNMAMSQLMEEFGIAPQHLEIYRKMEESFQAYVHGDNQQFYLGNYMVYSRDITHMQEIELESERTLERIEQLKLFALEKDLTINKINEVKRLTDNHVTNLEAIIRDLRDEVGRQQALLEHLERHESLAYRAYRKLWKSIDEKYPPGSLQRKKLRYKKEMLLHPIKYMLLYSTKAGQNLKKGDFEIGEVYREHGKLHFEQPEHPKVSIIIPAYNQISYTYLCLWSIQEHTRDVSYEIIIADDMSTDATEHMEEFAEGVRMARTSENLGFLRNCNQAAMKARGEYVMFLNNDTQVTEGWLSSLVRLIESDETIGMVGSKLIYPDGRLQEAGGIIWSDGSGWNYGRLDDPEKAEYNYVKEVDYISGAAILLSLKLWNQIGGFDERYAPAYCEDSDLAFEVRRAGYRVVYQPLSKVIHYEGISNGTDVQGTGLKRYQEENSKKLKEKWAEELSRQYENDGNPDPFRARERAGDKKIILVVDHYVPTYDKDAGSKTTFQYLKMFLSKGFIVKFLGDNFMREEPYTTTLQQMGIEVLYGADCQMKIWDWLRDHGDDISFAYLNRPHIATKYIDYILENTGIKVIYYGHDLHFLREWREYQVSGDAKKREESEYWKMVELMLLQKAAISYYPSNVECSAIWKIDPSIRVKAITAYVFDQFRDDIDEDFAKREGLLFVGGFAHPPNADAVLWFVQYIYPIIRRKMQEAGETPPNFYVVGSKVFDEIKALEEPGNGIIVKGFVSEEELSELYAACKVVVVPLRYGAGVKGKVVEAIYNGSPIVTTSIGAEGIPQVEDILKIADEPEQFAETVVRLYQDDEACSALCKAAQIYVRKHFSMEAAWAKIKEDFV